MKDDSPPPPYAEFDSNLLNHDLNPRKQHLPSAPPSPDYPEHVLYPRGLLETPNNHYQASLRPQNQPETTQNRGSTIFGPLPTKIVCPYCEVAIVTKTKYVPGKLVWLIMLGCAILGICNV
uniref:LITAF domain-containing protein n=1 Tax=Acrobeloides nanus TaxID=290746 RepID=A0A914DUM0_9BILA